MQHECSSDRSESERTDRTVKPRGDRDPFGVASQQHHESEVAQREEHQAETVRSRRSWRGRTTERLDRQRGIAEAPHDARRSQYQWERRNHGSHGPPRAVPVAQHAQDADGDFEYVDSPAVDRGVVRADPADCDRNQIGNNKQRSDVVSPPHAVRDGALLELALLLHCYTWPIWVRIHRGRPDATTRHVGIGHTGAGLRTPDPLTAGPGTSKRGPPKGGWPLGL